MKRFLSLLLALALVLPLACLTRPVQASGTKLAAITYDDGPGPYTNDLLDGLNARGVKATFFMVGTNAARYPDTIARIYQEGHQAANHSYSHPLLTKLSAKGVSEQVQAVNALLDKACGKGSDYMVRAPYGSINKTVSQAVGAPLINWSVDPLDWKYRNAQTVKDNILRQAKDGAIILVHDIHPTSVSGSLAAIDVLQAQGYEFVTVRELFRRRGVTPENGVRYSQVNPNGTDLGPVTAPTFSSQPEGEQLRVTLTAQEGADIYYTTSGGPLNQESTRYTGPFLITPPCTVKAAAAFNMNGSRSDIVEETFTIPAASAPEFHMDGGTLTLSCATPGAELHYALQDGAYQTYTAPIPLEPGTTVAAYSQKTGFLNSDVVHASYSPRGNFFLDLAPDQWYYDAMDQAVSAGYLGGTGEGRYQPGGKVHRAQLATMLYRFSGENIPPELAAELPYIDIPSDAYYAEAAAWAYERGLISGGDTFDPSRNITRQELCQLVYAYLQTLDLPLPEGSAWQYSDWDRVAPEAREAVAAASAIGLLNGDGEHRFRPDEDANRATAAVVLTRMADFIATAQPRKTGVEKAVLHH